MFPVIFKIGPLTIRTYGLLVAIGFFAALQYILIHTRRSKIAETKVLDVILYSIVGGLCGARLMYVVLNWKFYSRNFFEIFRIWEGGLVFYGGFFVSAIIILLFCRKHPEFKFWEFTDILAPAIALGHFFGRLGCLSAGCCYGLPTNMPWAIKFTNTQALAPLNIALHPTQIYEALGNFFIFVVLDWFNRYKHPHGQTIGSYLFLYGLLRFHVEFLRGDDRGSFVLGLSPSQIIALICIIGGIVIITKFRKYDQKNAHNS